MFATPWPVCVPTSAPKRLPDEPAKTRTPAGRGRAVTFSGNETGADRNENKPCPPRPGLPDEIDRTLGGRWPGRLRQLFEPLAPRPLAIGITRQIVAELKLDRPAARELKWRLAQWTSRPAYLEALIWPESQRYGLDGEPVSPVSPEHREAARKQLQRFRQNHRARKAALRSACQANAALPQRRLGRAGQ